MELAWPRAFSFFTVPRSNSCVLGFGGTRHRYGGEASIASAAVTTKRIAATGGAVVKPEVKPQERFWALQRLGRGSLLQLWYHFRQQINYGDHIYGKS